MTESEAERKSCPFHRYAPDSSCVASKCMMWRWEKWDGVPAHPGDKKEGDCALIGRQLISLPVTRMLKTAESQT